MDLRDDAWRSAALAATELARATALHRLALGIAHAMNNAFTSVLGETAFLQENRKDDPELDEACAAIREGVERCARMTRALLARRTPVSLAEHEIDLVRVVREVGAMLGDALSRRFALQLDAPDDLLLACAEPAAVEALLLLLVQHAEALSPGPGHLTVRAFDRDEDETVVLEVVLRAAELPAGCERSLADIDGVSPDVGRLTLVALHGVADTQRARLESTLEDGALHLRAVFAAVEEAG
jgi:signal transduction histidine kinase